MVKANPQDEAQCGQKERTADRIHGMRTRHIDESACRRPRNDRKLGARRIEGQRLRQNSRRHQQWPKRLLGGHLEGFACSQSQGRQENHFSIDPPIKTAPDQSKCNDDLGGKAEGKNPAAVEAIRHMPDDQRKGQRGRKLKQANQAEIPGAVGQIVHLPGNGNHHHLVGHRGRDAPAPEVHEGAMGKERMRGFHARHYPAPS